MFCKKKIAETYLVKIYPDAKCQIFYGAFLYLLSNSLTLLCSIMFNRGLLRLLHSELHWLDIPERVTYKLGVIMFGCQHGRAPQFLIDYCLPVSDVESRQHLRSASRRLLFVSRHRLSTYDRRAFAVAGPTAWNSFPDNLRDPDVTMDNFKRLLKTFLFSAYQCN